MKRISFLALAGFLFCLSLPAVHGDEETCALCNRKILVTGQFEHGRGHESLAIIGAPRRGEEAFREEIYGTNFSVTVPNLPAGDYTAVIGLAEVDFLQPGRRAFDITCGGQVIARNLDIFTAAGGVGKVLLLTNRVDFPGDALRGPLTFEFIGRTNAAKLNTFELRDANGVSLISLRAEDLVNAEVAAALEIPVVTGPEIWKDPSQPVAARVADLVSRLSLAEKIQEMRNGAAAVPRLGIPAYDYWSECLHGVARAGTATVFPQAIGMAATWDTPLIHDEADVIATEARAKHNDYVARHDGNSARYYGLTFWTPNVNIFRDPRWGRGQETYGEDPFLTGRLAVAFIRGLQGDDPNYIKAMACAKHFAVHSGPEQERHKFDVSPTDRDFHETYLPQFEAAVREGHVGAVMGAYNSVYGVPACANAQLLTTILRGQWGFTGHVVSDCGAIYDIYANHKYAPMSEEAAADAVKAGDDLCCGTDYNSLTRAFANGLISQKEIDTAVSRLFEARFRLGLFDPPDKVAFARIPLSANDTPAHEALALKVARESVVLLKNDGVLPLDRAKIKRIAVIGANADSVPVLLGNYNGTPARPVTILNGIQKVAGAIGEETYAHGEKVYGTFKAETGAGIEVIYSQGCPLALHTNGLDKPNPEMLSDAIAAAESADVVIYVGGISPQLEGEEMRVNYDGFNGGDRTRIELPAQQTELLKALAATGKPVVFVNCSGSAIAMPWAAEHLPAIVQAWYPGEQGGTAVADVLFGDINPAGRLPITFYRATADLPPFEDYAMSNRTYRYFGGQPEFAFGHGLSYTKFNYAAARLDKSKYTAGDTVKISFTLKNSGARDGDEVPQIYFRHVNAAEPQPKLALCGFARIHLAQGQMARITMDIPVERFRYWDTAQKQYAVESGDYELLVGAASDDVRLRVPFRVVASNSASAAANQPTTVQRRSDGVLLRMPSGALRLQVLSDRVIRVTFAPGKKLPAKKSFSVIAKPAKTKWQLSETPDAVVLKTPAIRARVDKQTGAVGFFDLNGKPILQEAENGRMFSPLTFSNYTGVSVRQNFILPPDERIYGLGQHQAGVWNYRGTKVHLQQRNMEVAVPVLVSSRGYGVLWDNPAITDVDVGKTEAGILSWTSEAGGAVDYYFMFGRSADGVVGDYRELTGAAPLMPEWLWGFWQCKERYQTQAEMTNIVAEYRKLGVPLDGIIQDWQYWTNGGWGSHAFDPARYDSPAEMVEDLHAMHAHVLISIWPKFDLGTANFNKLEHAGALYSPVLPSVYPKGEQKWYDPFNPAGRKIYWSLVSRDLFRLGFDGWWLDASEPELSGKWGEFRDFKTAAGPGAEVFNAYPLLHTTGLYRGQRARTDKKRVVILTRSAYAGQQRNSAITWSGDIRGNWAVFARQIPAGLNFSISGIPYWNTDIGGFFSGKATDKNYQELFTRWFQFGAFNPMFRVHGSQADKEIWRWDEPTQKILADYIRLRYRLLPYIYSTAWQVTSDGGTMLRPLMMDFGDDTNALDVGDQFLFGREIMVNPVTQAHAANRSVYLPGSGDWYDFWTWKRMNGGQRIEAASPIETVPLFVRAGSILPLGPVMQYTSEKPVDPIELRIYRGADGEFTLYEDQGDGYKYEKGAFATIPLTWNESAGTLTIGARKGKFPGMLKRRTFRVVFVDENHGFGGAETERADAIVKYDGTAVTVEAANPQK